MFGAPPVDITTYVVSTYIKAGGPVLPFRNAVTPYRATTCVSCCFRNIADFP